MLYIYIDVCGTTYKYIQKKIRFTAVQKNILVVSQQAFQPKERQDLVHGPEPSVNRTGPSLLQKLFLATAATEDAQRLFPSCQVRRETPTGVCTPAGGRVTFLAVV